MTGPALDPAARRYAMAALGGGRVEVVLARGRRGAGPPDEVMVRVRSSRDVAVYYNVDRFPNGIWSCSAPGCDPWGSTCRHIETVKLITGWPSTAAKPPAKKRST